MQPHRLRDERRVEAEERVVKQGGEVLAHVVALLQAAAHALCQRFGVRQLVVLGDVRVFGVERVHLNLRRAGEPAEKDVDELAVLLAPDPVVVIQVRRSEHGEPPT